MTLAARQLSLSAPAWSAFAPTVQRHRPSTTRAWGLPAECRAVDALQLAELEVRGPMPAGERVHSAVHGLRLAAGSCGCPGECLTVRGADLSARWPMRCWVA
jgi:hypothetical protein